MGKEAMNQPRIELKRILESAKSAPSGGWCANEAVDYLSVVNPQVVITLVESLVNAREALKFYARTRRDTSFEGWQKEWRYIKAEKESDYEYYPNHDLAIETLADLDARISFEGEEGK